MVECPVCLDAIASECPWACETHSVCSRCLYTLFATSGAVPCPLCRGACPDPLVVGYQSETINVWIADSKTAVYGNRQAELAHVCQAPLLAPDRCAWLGAGDTLMGVRTTVSGQLLFLAAGRCTPEFTELFDAVPPFAACHAANYDERLQRRMMRELQKAMLAFVAVDGLENIQVFLRTYVFPVQLTDLDGEAD